MKTKSVAATISLMQGDWTMNLEYLPEDTELKDAPLWWHTQTATGYGLHLTTHHKALYNGRWYRVYAACISNVNPFPVFRVHNRVVSSPS